MVNKKKFFTFLILIVPVFISLGVKIRLIDGTEANINIFQLTDEGAIVQAEGFFETIKLNTDEIEYILFDENNPSFLDKGGIVLTNGSVLYPKKFKIDVNEAVIETDSGVITCSLKEIASISYLFLNWFGEENVKGKIISTELSKDGKIKMMCLDNSYLVFSKLEIQDKICIGTDGKIRGVLNLDRIYWISFPEAYGENYPVYVKLNDNSFGYAKVLETTIEGLILETMTKERVSLSMNDIEMIDFEGYRKVRSSNLNLSEIKIDQNSKINMVLGKQKLGGFSFTLQRNGNQLVMSNHSKSVPYISRIVIKPVQYSIKWIFKTDGEIRLAGPAVAPDGTVYIGTDVNPTFYSIAPDGRLNWKYKVPNSVWSSPLITLDGTIYLASGDTLYSLSNDGRVKWEINLGGAITSSPTLYKGVLYVPIDRGYLCAISEDGRVLWKFKSIAPSNMNSSPAIKGDVLYFGSQGCLYALKLNGELLWEFRSDQSFVPDLSPAIGNNGIIYFASHDKLYAIGPTGRNIWVFRPDAPISSDPIIGQDGTIYIGDDCGGVYAISPGGNRKWKVSTGSAVRTVMVIGKDGTIYGCNEGGIVYAISSSGALKWTLSLNSIVRMPFGGISIAKDGTIYVGTSDGYLYAIQTTSLGLADDIWPKFKANTRNSGIFGEK